MYLAKRKDWKQLRGKVAADLRPVSGVENKVHVWKIVDHFLYEMLHTRAASWKQADLLSKELMANDLVISPSIY